MVDYIIKPTRKRPLKKFTNLTVAFLCFQLDRTEQEMVRPILSLGLERPNLSGCIGSPDK